MRTKFLVIAAAAASLATPALASDIPANPTDAWIYSDMNKHYLDYRTDISEARRELASDLRRANDEQDRIDARAEYRREIADAEHDFRKEMAEKGIILRRGTVTVESASLIP